MTIESVKKVCVLLFALFSITDNSFGQNQPELFMRVDSLVKFIASDYFKSLHNSVDDIYLIDTVYSYALKISPSIDEALLVIPFATLPFRKFPVKAPISGIKIAVPLPSGPESLFEKKIKLLPSHFLFDSAGKFGDKDKLAHFFGNAYLSYLSGVFTITEFMGILVELFENSFKENGEVNLRDMQLNYLGALFGLALRNNRNAKPSDFLKIYNIFYLRVY